MNPVRNTPERNVNKKVSKGVKPFVVKSISRLRRSILLLGDKSIAHRAVILSSLSNSETKITNFPANEDCLSTLNVFKKLGVKVIRQDSAVINVYGNGLFGLVKPKGPIFVGDSGTTMRLLLGVLAGQNFEATITAGKSLSKRPMRRVTEPLRRMGAVIGSRLKALGPGLEEYPPITICGGDLKSINYKMPVASAQVKSAILLAGLYAKGKTTVVERITTRDHTERMLKLFKANIKVSKKKICLMGQKELTSPRNIYIPADISSAAFYMVLAAILPNAEIHLNNVSLNPTRTGIINLLKRMNANIKVTRAQEHKSTSFEPMGDIIVKSSRLEATKIKKDEIPSLIDELPILMVAASVARGVSVFEGVGELRVKETDRINSMLLNLKKMGACISVSKKEGLENIIITGVKQLKGAKVKSFGDHRTAMSMVVAGLSCVGETQIDDINCIDKSFPGFIQSLKI